MVSGNFWRWATGTLRLFCHTPLASKEKQELEEKASTQRKQPKCLNDVWRASISCLEDVYREPRASLIGVWKVSRGCLEGVWRVSGEHLKNIRKVSARCQNGLGSVQVLQQHLWGVGGGWDMSQNDDMLILWRKGVWEMKHRANIAVKYLKWSIN